MKKSHNVLKIALPVLILVLGLSTSWALLATRPVLEPTKPESVKPKVTVIEAKPAVFKLKIHSQGVVMPKDEIDLISEVKGKIIDLHPDFVVGGFFAKNAVLARIDAGEYQLALAEAKAQIAESQRQLAMEQAQAEQARTEWKTLGEGTPTPLAMREPQLAEARAKLESAKAKYKLAELELARCEIRAPFAGLMQAKHVSLGQQVQQGDKLAKLYGTDVAEIRLPVSVDQLAFLNLEPSCSQQGCASVTLSVPVAGSKHTWQARIVRTEGVVDNNTGVIYLVAQIQNPYRQQNRPALLDGLFVEADIQGKELNHVFVLPEAALNASQEVMLVDKDLHLHNVPLKVLRHEGKRLLVSEGLKAGDKIVMSGIDVPVENTAVEIEQVLSQERL